MRAKAARSILILLLLSLFGFLHAQNADVIMDGLFRHQGFTTIGCPEGMEDENFEIHCYAINALLDAIDIGEIIMERHALAGLRPRPLWPMFRVHENGGIGGLDHATSGRIILLALAPDDIFVVLIAAEELTDHDLESDEPEVDEELDDAVPEDESLHEDTLEPDNFPTSSFEPYEVQRQRPIVVVLYNSGRMVGRQAGLREATTIYEFPLAMHLTQLVTVFDSVDPRRIGPIAPLQDYQYFIAEDLNGVIVHMGGQSVALDAVAQGQVPSFDAHEDRFRELYNRYQGESAPYNLYSDGTKLRDFLQVYDRDEARSVQGVAYRPIPELPEAGVLEVHYVGGYASGFHYIPELGLYRWHRSGVPATDADGEAVVTQAIVIAHVEAVSVMGDSEDRLKLAIDEGGEATLFLGGKVIAGRWQREDGFQFVAQGEQPLDLTPFKTWVKFVPPWARVTLP